MEYKTYASVISHNDPNLFHKMLCEFTDDVVKKNVHAIVNTNGIITGVDNKGMAQIQIIISAYITWQCTQEEYESFLFKQKMLIQA